MSEGNEQGLTEAPRENARKGAGPPRHGIWRTNLEAFTVAIVMALVIKQFAFEAFQVPTESMEPSIIGRKSNGDRIIVSKSASLVKDPKRWEVWVFHYPLSTLVNYVKRVVGLPGEEVRIIHGDIYAAPQHGGEFTVARKSAELQETILHMNPVIPEEDTRDFRISTFADHWALEGARRLIEEGILDLNAGKGELTAISRRKITIERHDKAAADRETRQDAQLATDTGDLRLELEVTPEAGSGALIMSIKDCTQPRLPIRLELAVEGGAERTRLTFAGEDLADEALAGLKLPTGKQSLVCLDNVDDTILVWVDGDVVFRHEYVQSMTRKNIVGSQVAFGLTEGRASFERVALYRDLFYTHYDGTPSAFLVPDDHYFFLGDNSPNSLDARGWRVVGIRLQESGKVVLGDMEAVSDDLGAPRQKSNPWLEPDDDSTHNFIDIHGNHYKLDPGSYDLINLAQFDEVSVSILDLHGKVMRDLNEEEVAFPKMNTPTLRAQISHPAGPFLDFSRLMHFTPRRNIIGQAFFVFWPPSRMGAIR